MLSNLEKAQTQPLIKSNFAEHTLNTHHTYTNIETNLERPQTKHHRIIWDIQAYSCAWSLVFHQKSLNEVQRMWWSIVVPSLRWKYDERTKHYLTQMLLAINWRYWQEGKHSRKHMKVQGGFMQVHFIEIHQVFVKKKGGGQDTFLKEWYVTLSSPKVKIIHIQI